MKRFTHAVQIMKELRSLALAVVLALVMAISIQTPVMAANGAAGAARQSVCEGVNVGGGTCADGGSDIQRVITVVIQILSTIAGIAAVIMLIVGGLKYITANGDSSSISSAKTTIIYAIIGLIIVAMAQIIVRFVLGKATQP